MSIGYSLYLTRPEPPQFTPRDHVRASSGLETEPSATWTAEDYGLRPVTYAYFTPDKWHLDEALVELAELVGEILRQADDDALLLMNGELPVLRRTAGRVVVSTRSEWTTPEALAAFGLPVELEDLGDVV